MSRLITVLAMLVLVAVAATADVYVVTGEPTVNRGKLEIPFLIRATDHTIRDAQQGQDHFQVPEIAGASEQTPYGFPVVPYVVFRFVLPTPENYDFERGGAQGFGVRDIELQSNPPLTANVPRVALRTAGSPDTGLVYAPFTQGTEPTSPIYVSVRPYLDDLIVKLQVNFGQYGATKQQLTMYREIRFTLVLDNAPPLQDNVGISEPHGIFFTDSTDSAMTSLHDGFQQEVRFSGQVTRAEDVKPEFRISDYRGRDVQYRGIYEITRYVTAGNELVAQYDLVLDNPDPADPEYDLGRVPMLGQYIVRDSSNRILGFRFLPIFCAKGELEDLR